MVKLREHLEAQITGLDKRLTDAIEGRDVRVQLALSAAKDAVVKAEAATDSRLALLNEFRAQAADESRKFALIEVIDPRIARLETEVATLQGRAVAFAGFGALIGASLVGFIAKFAS
jgi:hypothetical protein